VNGGNHLQEISIMKHSLSWALSFLVLSASTSAVEARGFGRAGGWSRGGGWGYARGGYGYARGGYYGGYRGPYGGVSAYHARGGTVVGPYGGVAAGGARGRTVTTPGGTTIQHGAAGGARYGPYGGYRAGGASGTRVTTPSGQTYTHARGGAVAGGPGGRTAASGWRGGVATGPRGTVAGGSRAGVAVGPYGGLAGVSRGGVAIGPRGAVVGHSTWYASPVTLTARGNAIRGGYYNCFTRGWYVNHPGLWRPAAWIGPSFWVAPTWPVLAPFCDLGDVTPVSYDYGSTTVINDNQVYADGVDTGGAGDYAQQAIDSADRGRDAKASDKGEWRALGVFGLVQPEDQTAQQIFQLGINKDGIVRGNYYNALTDQTSPVYGALDKKTQRVSWSVGKKKDVVFEAGLFNLTQKQSTALVHYGKDRTIQMLLIRLEEPKDDTK
jgi:hypothetical protein